jgi:hypothetical protein
MSACLSANSLVYLGVGLLLAFGIRIWMGGAGVAAVRAAAADKHEGFEIT